MATVRFCSRCGAPPRGLERVCLRCGLGVCLRRSAAQEGRAFVVVGEDLRLAAVSEAAEGLLGPQPSLVGARVTDVLEADEGPGALVRSVRFAALGGEALLELRVRPAGAADGAARVRVGACGPPHAALLSWPAERL